MPGDDVEKLPPWDAVEGRWQSRKRRRRTVAARILFFILAAWACYQLLQSRQSDPILPESTVDSARATTTASVHSENEQEKESTRRPADVSNHYPPLPSTDFASSLHRLFAILPDEFQVENILRPIETTGEARLYELGLRTRYFRIMFEVWEAVHLVPSEDRTALYIRDDVLQHLQRHPQIAASLGMTTTQVIHGYEHYRSVITELSTLLFPWTAPYYSDHMHLHAQFYGAGKGLVFLAKDDQAPFLLTSIPVIRQMGCHLPIEVFYMGDHDLAHNVRAQLEALPGVTTRDLRPMVDDQGWELAGWAGKPFAILLSSFRQAIFIDADALFLQNPETLFADEAYLANGALFFKDRLMMRGSKRKWLQDILPKPISDKILESRPWTGESSHMQESGVVVVDKWKHLTTLLLVSRMNGPDRDGDKEQKIVGVYDMVYGDKETFWLGWELAGDLEYAFHDGDAGVMGVLESSDTPTSPEQNTNAIDYTICAPQLLHLDRHGRPLWFNGWMLPNKYDKQEREPMVFEAFLQEPRGMQEPAAWQLHQSNICCLTADHKKEFTAGERDVLDSIVATGRRAGALGKAEAAM